jgi:ribosome biogenesis protein SSF1/2
MVLFSQKNARDVAKGSRQRQSQQDAVGNINLRISRTPRGPTVTFRVNKFALARDVSKAQRRTRTPGGEYQTAPLLVLNNFGSAERHIKLLVSVFQGLFPPIHVQSMHLSEARRIVLLNYNAETQTIDYRHYMISVRPVGVSRRVRRVIEGTSADNRGGAKRIPNLSSAADISEYLMGRRDEDGESVGTGGFETDASSASEADSDVDDEGTPRNHIKLPNAYVGRGNVRDSQRAVRLRELGPRMELRCVKIEEGIPGAGKEAKGSSGGNEVLWHAYVNKSNAETNKQRKAVAERNAQREKRKAEQAANVARKQAEKEALKSKGKRGARDELAEEPIEVPVEGDGGDAEEEDDEFAYEDMHGAEPQADDADLFEDDDVEIDDDASVGEISHDEDEEDFEDEGDSDLSPIEIDEDDYESDDETMVSSKTTKSLKKSRRG